LAQFGKELEEYRSNLYKKEYLPHVKVFPKGRELFERIRQDDKRVVLGSFELLMTLERTPLRSNPR